VNSAARLAWRAVLAIALMVSFYVLALLVVGVLLAIPVVLWNVAKGLLLQLGLFCLVGAFVILKAIFPRADRFEPPGPLLTPDKQPDLFAEICDLAVRTGQDEPAEVYLIADANAWVNQRGGFMGLGGRRVMGLGLPLLQTLTIPELRGVLAHEFGHFHGGDVAVGPWIHKTRAALVRTVVELKGHSEALSRVFIWYGNHFFRVSHAVSRHQELLADRLAADIVGVDVFASGLRGSNSAGLAFARYWNDSVSLVLSFGFAPPLASGFEAFMKTPTVATDLAEALKHQALHEKPQPYDTHPPLADRLVALGASRSSLPRVRGTPAVSLLHDLEALETALAKTLVKGAAKGPAKGAVAWEEVGERVWLPLWQAQARRLDGVLAGITPGALPDTAWERIGRRLLGRGAGEAREAADFAVGIGLAVLLARAGLRVESLPGRRHATVGRGERVEIFDVRTRLAEGQEAVEAWRNQCARLGIADADLGAACASEPTLAERLALTR